MKHRTRKRIWFWALFLSANVATFRFGIYPLQHLKGQSHLSAEILQPRISADARFHSVRIVRGTNGAFILGGEVQSDSELDDLKRLVDDAHPPRRPTMQVRVISTPK